MGFWQSLLGREPDKKEELLKMQHGKALYNNINFNVDGLKELNLYQNVREFIAKEFTKVKFTISDEIPNVQRMDYLLNLAPNSSQTANDMLYDFAFGMLSSGCIYYRVVKNDRAITQIYLSRTAMPGYTKFEKSYLRISKPTKLLAQYAKLLSTLSSDRTDSIIEISTRLESPTEDTTVEDQVNARLGAINEEINESGLFLIQNGEETKDHPNIKKPGPEALQDLKSLIYESYNINQKILQGSYSEEDYRAFWATQLQPLANALEELFNYALLDYNTWTSGARIGVIMDLQQFSTLASFRDFADKGLYDGFLNADEVRTTLGKEPLKNGVGKIYYSNANAKRLTNPDGSLYEEPVQEQAMRLALRMIKQSMEDNNDKD